jgi:flagellar FliL protein
MANAKPTETETSAAPLKKKSKLMLFIIIGAVVLSLIGGAAFFLLKKSAPAAGEENAETTSHTSVKKTKAEHNAPPVFYKFDKPFTVKLQTSEQDAYLQTEVQLKLQDPHGQELIKQYEPELKHRMTLAMMGKKASDLLTAPGVQRLANELRDVANHVIEPPPPQKNPPATEAEPTDNAEPDAPIQSVLFTTFIIQ